MRNQVKNCIHSCYFYESHGHDMECAHPDFDADPDPYAGHIITYGNVKGKIPKKCPLRTADLTIKKVVTKKPHDGTPETTDKVSVTYSLLNEAEAELVKSLQKDRWPTPAPVRPDEKKWSEPKTSVMIVCKKCGKPFMAFTGLDTEPIDQPCPYCELDTMMNWTDAQYRQLHGLDRGK